MKIILEFYKWLLIQFVIIISFICCIIAFWLYEVWRSFFFYTKYRVMGSYYGAKYMSDGGSIKELPNYVKEKLKGKEGKK